MSRQAAALSLPCRACRSLLPARAFPKIFCTPGTPPCCAGLLPHPAECSHPHPLSLSLQCGYVNKGMPQPLPGAALGFAPCDPSGLTLTPTREEGRFSCPAKCFGFSKPPLPTTLGWEEELSKTICNIKAWQSKLLLICANNSLGNFGEVSVSVSTVLTLCL